MKIFGFTITRTSKKKEYEQELDIFKKCVCELDKASTIAKAAIMKVPSIETLQAVTELQEHLESLIEIYSRNKFSKPANMYTLSHIRKTLREVILEYTRAQGFLAHAKDEMNRVKLAGDNTEVFGVDFKNIMEATAEKMFNQAIMELRMCAEKYCISLNALRFAITYDITRIETGVDIIKEYEESQKMKIPNPGIDFIVKFRKLSRDEINQQKMKIKEAEEDES